MKYHKIAFIFPGQGSQYVGMGQDFSKHFSSSREVFEEADEVLQRFLSKIVFEGPKDLLTETRNNQPGIFVNSMVILKAIQEQFPDLKPCVCAGLSLGEYTAVAASGRLPFVETLQLVQYRADYMNEACEATNGEMAVVIGLDHDLVESIVEDLAMPEDLWAANFNCPSQVVISGTPKGIKAGSVAAKEKGARRVLPLNVHGAFHSGLMASAEELLGKKVEKAPLKDSDVGLVMNITGDYESNLSVICRNLIGQVTNPVRWERGIRSMLSKGVDLFIEIGCGTTLSGMNKRINELVPTISIDKVSDLEKLHEIFS